MWKVLHPFIRQKRSMKFRRDFCKLSDILDKVKRNDNLQYIYYLAVSGYSCQDDDNCQEAGLNIDKAITSTRQSIDIIESMIYQKLSQIESISKKIIGLVENKAFSKSIEINLRDEKKASIAISLKISEQQKAFYEELICSLYKLRTHINPAESKQRLGLQEVNENIVLKCAVSMQVSTPLN